MLFAAFTTLALALAGTVRGTPVATATTLSPIINSVSAAASVPVVSLDLGSVAAHGNVTVGNGAAHTDAAEAIYPATIFFCSSFNCSGCAGFDLSIQPHQMCLSPGFNFVSMFISQPSNEGLPFAIYMGPVGLAAFAQVPVVNTCYNANNYVGWDLELFP